MKIKTLFDSEKEIDRKIEKVITYGVSQEDRLKAEISEYIVTESIEEQFEKLLTKMQLAMESGGENEVGVWVSGFYGSGKSSFTKYLGLSFDDNVKVDGIPFIQHLQDRLNKSTTKALLNTVAKRFPAAVLMLDLASEQVAGATMEEVSTVLYYKVLQWAGYSRNLKVAAFERKLKKEGRYDEFLDIFEKETEGHSWNEYRNDELVVDSLIPGIAHKMYPNLFPNENAFSTEASEIIRFEDDRVSEMLEIAREATGKEYIIFIIDEVGQYVGSRQNLILNLDGLAKNLKNIGNGKVWIIGTAQQTLTEDDPKATLNSPELYKLKDRFPIQIDLEANDIKEICYSRLLAKSTSGESELGSLFDDYGQKLRHNTKLQDARAYGADFDKKTFIDLYPFLPAHFDILLHLLGALAKSTGGIGLRSAIKVIQDILVEGSEGTGPIAEKSMGWLANTVTLFDALEKDIKRANQSLHHSVSKVNIRFPDSPLHQGVVKTVCVLQILGNLPITTQNITSLMHSEISDDSSAEAIKSAVEDLITDSVVPFGVQDDDELCFYSEKLNDIAQDRSEIPKRSIELRRIENEALREVFSPLPTTKIFNSLSVTTGLKSQNRSGSQSSLSGDRNTIQTIVELVEPTDYEATKARILDDSRHSTSRHIIYLIGRADSKIEELALEIYRSREIANMYRNEADQEVKEYCSGQIDRANRLMADLERIIKRSLLQGSFVFRGESTAVDSLGQELLNASRTYLSDVAEEVFEKYKEAPVRAGTSLAEQFLRQENLTGITQRIDPLNLVQVQGGRPSINTEHKAITSIRDFIDLQGSIDGKRLSDVFSDAPYGWSPDTLRYLVAAMLVAGEIKLRVSSREIKVRGQQAIDALKTNNAFKSVGVSLRDERPSNELLATAASRLTELSGDTVIPLEDEISKAATKLFPQLQHEFGPLSVKFKNLGLPGVERLENLSNDIRDILNNDASDAPKLLGADESALFNDLKWATEIKRAFDQGLEDTLANLQDHVKAIKALPDTGIPGKLKNILADDLAQLEDRLSSNNFYEYGPDYSTRLTNIRTQIRDAVSKMKTRQKERIKNGRAELTQIKEWNELTKPEQNDLVSELDAFDFEVQESVYGLKELLNQQFSIQTTIEEIKQKASKLGKERLQEKIKERQEKAKESGQSKISQKVSINRVITSMDELDKLISQLKDLRGELQYAHEFEILVNQSNESEGEN
jgi:hypothetical protein